MNDSKIPVRYAKALFDLALEHDSLDSVYKDMQLLLYLCSMKEVKQILENPVIRATKRGEILKALFENDVEPLTLKFLDLVFRQDRESHLAAMARDFLDLTRRHRGIRQVTLTTAVPANEKVRGEIAAITATAGASKIEFMEKTDKSLIGGFILRVDDTYIDASVRRRLNRFKKEFTEAGNIRK
ncbi:MAG: ATP synthase F1 subunit delta [Bacteroidales bacterium]|jgi:F-type H+-transporting ATPase subunit delta|nr:ATP synthase F1 subunit delta [Bacteroidales bacterium]